MKLSVWLNLASKLLRQTWIPLVVLTGIGAICYLAFASRLGFYNDDWYLLYAGNSQGAQKFLDVFSGDRPFRGYFMAWIFSLFGNNSLYYSFSAFIMRCVAALGWYWILHRTWPQERLTAYLAALFSLVYPGFLDQPNSFDFQSHQWSFALAVLSITCTVGVFQTRKFWVQVALVIASILTQVAAYSLMEYFIGLEGLRFLLVIYLALQVKTSTSPVPSRSTWAMPALLAWLPILLSTAGFLYWEIVILPVTRDAINVNMMVEGIAESPALWLVWKGVDMLRDLFNVVIVAWVEPVYRLVFALRLKLILFEFALAIVAAALTWLALKIISSSKSDSADGAQKLSTSTSMILVGLFSAVAALAPVHLGDRAVVFESFSRFSLTPSLGAMLVIAGVWRAIGKWRLKLWLAVGMVFLATLVHAGNTLAHAETWNVVRSFWWQVSWRIPQLEPGTVLIVDYAGKGIAEDYFVWGPANLIYYPRPNPMQPDELTLTAVTLNRSDLTRIQARIGDALIESTILGDSLGGKVYGPILEPDYLDRRSLISEKDYTKLLVLSMPTELSCVHLIDHSRLELSDQSSPSIIAMAPYSQIEQVTLSDEMHTPPQDIFGEEPVHDWCYYYQKASLARQRGDWQEILDLAEIVRQRDLRPIDWIEWMPFLQAYIYDGEEELAETVALIIRANPAYQVQACLLTLDDSWDIETQQPVLHNRMVDLFCMPIDSH